MLFSKNVSQNPVLVQRLLCARSALSFGPYNHHNTIRDCPEAFPWVYDHHQGAGSSKFAWENTYHFGRSHIWICAFTNLAKCQVIWELDSLLPIPGGGHTLPKNTPGQPLEVLWVLRDPNESAEWSHWRCCTQPEFWNMFFEKSMHFSATDFSSTPDLEG